MNFGSMTAVLYAATMLAIAPAIAQGTRQDTGPTPPAAASPVAPSGARQPMPAEMMQMMQMMHGTMPRLAMMGGSMAMPGGGIRDVEGHIAFLKAELKITDAQQAAWDQFADALRSNAKALNAASGAMMSDMMAGMMGGADKTPPLAARLEQQGNRLTLQLEALGRSRAALDSLNAVLSDDQKRRLDQLI